MPQKLVTLKDGKSGTGGWRHSLYTSVASFDEKDLHICSCLVFKEQLFLRRVSNYSGDVSRGKREQSYAIQFLHRQGKNYVETLHTIQTMYKEEALLRIPLSVFFARHRRRNLTDHTKIVIR